MSKLTRREQIAVALIGRGSLGFSEVSGPTFAQELASEVELIVAELDKSQPAPINEATDIEAFAQFWKRYNEGQGPVEVEEIWLAALRWERGGRK